MGIIPYNCSWDSFTSAYLSCNWVKLVNTSPSTVMASVCIPHAAIELSSSTLRTCSFSPAVVI